MNSYDTENLAERLQVAKLKVDEAIKEARVAFEKTTTYLRDGDDEDSVLGDFVEDEERASPEDSAANQILKEQP